MSYSLIMGPKSWVRGVLHVKMSMNKEFKDESGGLTSAFSLR